MVELADTPDLGSGVERLAGSSPVTRTIKEQVERPALLMYVESRIRYYFIGGVDSP